MNGMDPFSNIGDSLMPNSISKTFKFEKIAFYGGRRINSPEVTVELCYTDKWVGNVWMN